MTTRNLSPQQMFIKMAQDHQPEYAFSNWQGTFDQWKAATLPKVLDCLGDAPDTVPLNPEMTAEWQHHGLRKQRWLIDVSPHISATFVIAFPPDLKPGQKYPAILCAHGHGPHGKEPIMGNDSSPPLQQAIAAHNYNYGHEMAKAGFITYAIDWIGFGERNDNQKPNWLNHNAGRDWCNLYYLHATMFGMTSISINVAHGKAATDFACTFPEVDPDKLGVMGLSGGGTMTLWMTLCDSRIKAAEIMCYSDLWAAFGIRDLNYCGMQVAPGLYKLVDLPDAQGLIAPRPLLIDIGIHDTCFKIDTSSACYKQLKTIYQAANASQNLELDQFPDEHKWGANKSIPFFTKHVGSPAI